MSSNVARPGGSSLISSRFFDAQGPAWTARNALNALLAFNSSTYAFCDRGANTLFRTCRRATEVQLHVRDNRTVINTATALHTRAVRLKRHAFRTDAGLMMTQRLATHSSGTRA